MTPSGLQTLDREQVILHIEHILIGRLLDVEPDALSIDAGTGLGSALTVTEEGKFLADTLRTLDNMRR